MAQKQVGSSRQLQSSYKGTILGGFLISAPLIPLVATIVSIAIFVAQLPNNWQLSGWIGALVPFAGGTIFACLSWLLFALLYLPLTAVDRADINSYTSLANHLSQLETDLKSYPDIKTEIETLQASSPQPQNPPAQQNTLATPDSQFIAQQEALQCWTTIRKKLNENSIAWVMSSGYIDIWNQIDTAEEALIEFEPSTRVIRDALYDEMRLQGSTITNSDDLLNQLRLAIKDIDPTAVKYLKAAPKTADPPVQEETPSPAIASTSSLDEIRARSILRNVRQAFNEYREDRWSRLITVRNQLIGTMGLASLTLYILLEFSLIAGATRISIITATVFYLVGAISGLFSRLYSESQSNVAIDDYRLAGVRLLFTPLFSGLAAVVGVLLVQKGTSLGEIYSFPNFLSGLLIAAGFGLTPNALINVLKKQTDSYQGDLKSTQATDTQTDKST